MDKQEILDQIENLNDVYEDALEKLGIEVKLKELGALTLKHFGEDGSKSKEAFAKSMNDPVPSIQALKKVTISLMINGVCVTFTDLAKVYKGDGEEFREKITKLAEVVLKIESLAGNKEEAFKCLEKDDGKDREVSLQIQGMIWDMLMHLNKIKNNI